MTFNARERAHELCQDIGGNCDKLTNALMLAYQAGTDAHAEEVARLREEVANLRSTIIPDLCAKEAKAFVNARESAREVTSLQGELATTRRLLASAVKCGRDGYGHAGNPTCAGCATLAEADAFLASPAATPPAPEGERPACELCDVGVPWCRTPCDGCPNPGAWEARRAKFYTPSAPEPPQAVARVPEPGVYRHFKGGRYEVLGVAVHSESHAEFVVYRSCADGGLWVRPEPMFNEVVNGVPRFQRVPDTAQEILDALCCTFRDAGGVGCAHKATCLSNGRWVCHRHCTNPPAAVPGEVVPTPCGHSTGTYQTAEGRTACLACSRIFTPAEEAQSREVPGEAVKPCPECRGPAPCDRTIRCRQAAQARQVRQDSGPAVPGAVGVRADGSATPGPSQGDSTETP